MKKFCEECQKEFIINPKNKRSAQKRFCSSFCAKTNSGKKNKGRKHSPEVNRKKGRPGETNPMFGKHLSPDAKNKISKTNKGRKHSPEVNRKKGRPGETNPMFGKHLSDRARQKISENHSDVSGINNPMYGNGDRISGDKNGGWYGGISKNPYGSGFNRTLKGKIRKRDNYKCVICNKTGRDVHHINYNKNDNLERNLITLCHSHHMKTNFNRIFWEKYFKTLIKSIYGY